MHTVLGCGGAGMMSSGMMGGWGWWPIAAVFQVAVWALVIWLVVRFARPWLRQPRYGPERLLAERFADGTIDADEYERRLDVLRSSRDVHA